MAKTPPRRDTSDQRTGVWYPRWYWPSFVAPGSIWLAVMFVLPFYVVFAVAFGSVDQVFRLPVPYYAPWWWSFHTFDLTLSKFYEPPHIYLEPLIRTLEYVFAASAWQGLLDAGGPINRLLQPVGFGDTRFLEGKPITVILGLVYGYIPFMILPIYASLDRIQESLLEAGRDLGGSGASTFWRVTLPLSRPAILAGIVIVTLPMFGDYYTNDLLGTTKTSMFGNLIAQQREATGGSTAAASLVLILSVIVLIPMLYYLRETKRQVEQS